MLNGMTYLLVQIAVPMAAVWLLGFAIGWGLHRDHRSTDHSSEATPPLVTAENRIQELEADLLTLRDEKDTEFGRLETAAIEAMESTIADSAGRVAELESRLADASAELHRRQDELLTQRRQHEQLKVVLRQRDQRIAELRSTEDTAR